MLWTEIVKCKDRKTISRHPSVLFFRGSLNARKDLRVDFDFWLSLGQTEKGAQYIKGWEGKKLVSWFFCRTLPTKITLKNIECSLDIIKYLVFLILYISKLFSFSFLISLDIQWLINFYCPWTYYVKMYNERRALAKYLKRVWTDSICCLYVFSFYEFSVSETKFNSIFSNLMYFIYYKVKTW